MSQSLILRCKGLWTSPNELSAVPEGALLQATNVDIRDDDIATPRRGFDRLSAGWSDSSYRTAKLWDFKDLQFAHYGTSGAEQFVAYYSSGTWHTLTGTYLAPTGDKIQLAEGNQNLYFTTSAGIYKLDAYNGTPVLSGAYKALDLVLSTTGSSGFLANGDSVAYRGVWGYYDANENLIQGTPSQRVTVTCASGGGSTRNIAVVATLPRGVTTSWIFQLYRSASVTGTPSDDLQLVYETSPVAGDITAGTLTITDLLDDDLRGAALYTNANQETIAQANERPPLAKTICMFQNRMFCGNTTGKQRFKLTLIATGSTNGLAINDTVTIAGVTYTAKSAEAVASREFKVFTGGTITQDIADTAYSLISILNRAVVTTTATTTTSSTAVTVASASNLIVGMEVTGTGIATSTTVTAIVGTTLTLSQAATATGAGVTLTFRPIVYASYLSGENDAPGQILIEERGIGLSAYTVTSSRTTCWSQTLPDTSSNDAAPNGLMWSKDSQYEAVPLANYAFVGSKDAEIKRIVALRDNIIIFKDDGVWRLTGEAGSYRIDRFDNTTRLIASETVQVLNNQVWALTDQGVVAIGDSIAIRSRPIEKDLLELFGATLSLIESQAFAVAYETDRKYILFLPDSATATYPNFAYVFNIFTNAWTDYALSATCGAVSPTDKKLYLGHATSEYVWQEKKNYNYLDFSDYGAATSISAINSNVLTLATNVDQAAIGDVIYVSDDLYALIEDVDTVAGTATVTVEPGFSIGAATIQKSVAVVLEWVPVTGGNPGIMKQFYQVDPIFKQDFTGTATMDFETELSPSVATETLTGSGNGAWALFEWGEEAWGGEPVRRPIRVWVPRPCQRCVLLSITFNHSVAYSPWELQGLTVFFTPGSEDTSR